MTSGNGLASGCVCLHSSAWYIATECQEFCTRLDKPLALMTLIIRIVVSSGRIVQPCIVSGSIDVLTSKVWIMQRRSGIYASFLSFFFVLSLALVALAAPRRALAAQNAKVQLSVDAGYEGYYRANDWVPLLVTVTNSGPDITGQ